MMSKILIGTGWTASGTGLYRRASQRFRAQVAQLVEHVTENHGVGGSIPSLGTIFLSLPVQPGSRMAAAVATTRINVSAQISSIRTLSRPFPTD